MSAAEWVEIEEEAKISGVTKFITKPLFPSALIDAINECLSLHNDPENDISLENECIFAGKCILLVEDVEVNREIVQALLEPTVWRYAALKMAVKPFRCSAGIRTCMKWF